MIPSLYKETSAYFRENPWLFFLVPTKLKPHRRQNLICEIRFAARTKPLKQRRTQDRHRYAFLDRSIDGPTSFTRVRNTSRETFQLRMLCKRDRRQIQQP